jgi:hypothetical protein
LIYPVFRWILQESFEQFQRPGPMLLDWFFQEQVLQPGSKLQRSVPSQESLALHSDADEQSWANGL